MSSPTTEPSLTGRSFAGISLSFYPPGIYAIPFGVLGIIVWFLLTGPFTAPLLLATTGIAGYLLIPIIAGVAIGSYGVLGAIRQMLTAHRLPFLPLTMDFSEEEPTLTIPFVGQLENAPLNIPGLTAPIVRTVQVPGDGDVAKEETVPPVTSLGLYVFQAPVYIPQPTQIPRFWAKVEQPVDKMFFISQWDLNTIKPHAFPGWVGYKRLLTIGANVLPMYVSLIRAKRYVQNEKPIPVWWISGCKGSVRDAQTLTRMKYLTHDEFVKIENTIGETIAYDERFKRESVEAENNTLKKETPNLSWSVDMLYEQRRRWETEGLDTSQPTNWKWLGSKWGVVTLISIVVMAVIVMGIVFSIVKHP